jgi:hypothetical protein
VGFATPTRIMTPHIKKKNCKKKSLNPPTPNFHLNKEEKRKKRKKRRKRNKRKKRREARRVADPRCRRNRGSTPVSFFFFVFSDGFASILG